MQQVDVVAVRQGTWSLVGGLLVGAGWWCMIDGLGVGANFVGDPASAAAASYAWLPLLGALAAFLMINCMMWGELQDNPREPTVAGKARVFLLLALFVLIASVAGAAFIMVDKFLSHADSFQWAGVSCFVGTLLIALAAFVMRFGTLPGGSSET